MRPEHRGLQLLPGRKMGFLTCGTPEEHPFPHVFAAAGPAALLLLSKLRQYLGTRPAPTWKQLVTSRSLRTSPSAAMPARMRTSRLSEPITLPFSLGHHLSSTSKAILAILCIAIIATGALGIQYLSDRKLWLHCQVDFTAAPNPEYRDPGECPTNKSAR